MPYADAHLACNLQRKSRWEMSGLHEAGTQPLDGDCQILHKGPGIYILCCIGFAYVYVTVEYEKSWCGERRAPLHFCSERGGAILPLSMAGLIREVFGLVCSEVLRAE